MFKFWSPRAQEYSPLSPDDERAKEDEAHIRHFSKRKRHALPAGKAYVALLHSLIALLAIAVVTLTVLFLRSDNNNVQNLGHGHRLHCGSSVAEAQVLGCVYDNLVKGWIPAVCPQLGKQEFVTAGYTEPNSTGWPYYADKEGTRRLTDDELAFELAEPFVDNGLRFWTTEREHVEHCAWMLMRVAHVLVTDARRDTLVTNVHHSNHCILLLKEWALKPTIEGLDDITVEANVGFGSC
ncbi:hypothetical protein X797_011842 [Metarhizium robertsii]|uniref:Uncharacterized protein n=2 Tax=Metarhizium robertsii TaxID=568076 RepID=E9FCM8_METRA|nr:uncharacterized protein MAA_10027 [Metarhizium robertsii ARSEF 23]EFY94535.1 hypothetical protein MAA_10027 [Metarhizium robertsii ARSEF 23]EXU95083.1 hypothetical protein X797_011842 [Metarhizium robertsii]